MPIILCILAAYLSGAVNLIAGGSAAGYIKTLNAASVKASVIILFSVISKIKDAKRPRKREAHNADASKEDTVKACWSA